MPQVTSQSRRCRAALIAVAALALRAASMQVPSSEERPRRTARPDTHVDSVARPTVVDDATKELLVTTGYWLLDNSASDSGTLRNGPGGYLRRMRMVMSLNTPITIYGDDVGVENMRRARGNATPALVGEELLPIEGLEPCKSHGKHLRENASRYTHPLHMHSITLACIWDGKFSLLGRTAKKHPGYKWYAWLDIGMHGGAAMDKVFRDHGSKPWPNAKKLASLPYDKISASRTSVCSRCKAGEYLPFCHCAAATAILVPGPMVQRVVELFYEELEKCLARVEGTEEGYPCLSEQVIMSQMELSHPGLYHFIGKGYGTIAANLTSEFAFGGTSDLFGWLSAEEGEATTMLAAEHEP